MKKLITFIFALLMLTAVKAYSQNVALNAYSFYTLDDNIEATSGNYYYEGTIKGNLLWGAGLEFFPTKDYGIELAYFRQDTDVPSSYNLATLETKTFKLGANYIMLGGTRYLRLRNPAIVPFGGAMFGMAIMENKEPRPGAESSSTNFAWQLKGGVNIMVSKQVGIKLQMHLLSAVQSAGGGLYLGTGGAGYGVNTNSTMLQFGIGGGLVFRFGK
jgi:hypothetical protein